MTVTFTARIGLPHWSAGSDPLTRAQLDAAMASIESLVALYGQGPIANRPAPGKAGRYWMAAAAGGLGPILSYDDGSAWTDVRPDLSMYYTRTQVDQLLTGKASSTHVHSGADITSGQVPLPRLGTGSPTAATWLRGDGVWTALPVQTLAILSDVTLTGPAVADVLRYDGNRWRNAALGVTDLPVAAAGETSSTKLVRASDPRLADSRTPIGPAGGHLTGTYPNPSVALVGIDASTPDASTAPSDYAAAVVRWSLRNVAAVGLPASADGSTITSAAIRGERVATTAGAAHETAFCDTGHVYTRRGTSQSGNTWGVWRLVARPGAGSVFTDDSRLAADGSASQASVRTLGPGALQAAPGNHTHNTKLGDTDWTAMSLATGWGADSTPQLRRLNGVVYARGVVYALSNAQPIFATFNSEGFGPATTHVSDMITLEPSSGATRFRVTIGTDATLTSSEARASQGVRVYLSSITPWPAA